jgi:UDP-glucuronate decarboxylase
MNAPDTVNTPVNLGNPDECTIQELAERIVALTGSGAPMEARPLPADDPIQRCPDIGLAKEKLGWEPTVALKEGLERTIEHFRKVLRGNGKSATVFDAGMNNGSDSRQAAS